MFNNNNNYLPDLNHYPPAGQLPSASIDLPPPEPTPTMPGGSGYIRTGNFRFLSPTQGTAVPTWIPSSCATGVATAPGLGASWQHSVPSTMPWANHVTPHFTAQSTMSQSLPVYTMHMTVTKPQTTMMQASPKPSISRPPKRCLQSSTTDPLDGPSCKKYLSERMAASFRQLQITPSAEHSENDASGNASIPGSSYSTNNGWVRFHEVEKRLEEDLEMEELGMASEEEAGSSTPSDTEAAGKEAKDVVLTIHHEVEKEVKNLSPVLPESIVKTITNPCMDLVLWKAPETVITSSVKPAAKTRSVTSSCSSSHRANNTQVTTATSCPQSLVTSSTPTFYAVSTPQFSSGVADMEMFDSLDDDMDL